MTAIEEVPYTPRIGDIAVRKGGGTSQYKVVGVWDMPGMPLRVSVMYTRDDAAATGWLPADNFDYTPTTRTFAINVPYASGQMTDGLKAVFNIKVAEERPVDDERLYGVIFNAITEADAGDSRWWDLTQRKAATDKVFAAVKKEIGR